MSPSTNLHYLTKLSLLFHTIYTPILSPYLFIAPFRPQSVSFLTLAQPQLLSLTLTTFVIPPLFLSLRRPQSVSLLTLAQPPLRPLTTFVFHVFHLVPQHLGVHTRRLSRPRSIHSTRSGPGWPGYFPIACIGRVDRNYGGGCNVCLVKFYHISLLTFYIFYFLCRSILHPSSTEFEPHWTSRVFASTPGSGSIYLGGLHSFSLNSSSTATFRFRSLEKKSTWRRRTEAYLQSDKVRDLMDV
jgi:hypothetical protein